MTKKEVIWREILFQARQNKKIKFTQKELAQSFNFSLSTVFNALKTPREANIVEVRGRYFVLRDYKKLLYLWASNRSIRKDFIYRAFVEGDVSVLEAKVPAEAVFGLYSAFKFSFGNPPADYDHIYIYFRKAAFPKLLERLSATEQKSPRPNFFVLKKDDWQERYGQALLPEQIFVDIWNAPEWYAKDFLKALEEKLSI